MDLWGIEYTDIVYAADQMRTVRPDEPHVSGAAIPDGAFRSNPVPAN